MKEKVLVIGLGKSGMAAINFLLEKGYSVIANDLKEESALQDAVKQYQEKDVHFVLGRHDVRLFDEVSKVILSPGVPSEHPVIKQAVSRGLVISEVELAYQHYPHNWVCITGTDGKSTTTSLIGHIVKTSGQQVVVAGNIGQPLTDAVLKAKNGSIIVAELSSFQLENIIRLKPKIGLILNIAEDHLDRYSNMEEYISAKLNIFRNQTAEDYAVLNSHNELLMKKTEQLKIKAKKLFFNLYADTDGAVYKNNSFCYNEKGKVEVVCPDGIQKIKGSHNKENILAAIAAAKILHIDNQIIAGAIETFSGLPHRMEYVRNLNNVSFYNDSKATTISAVYKGLEGFNNIILIMGGRDKGLDFTQLNDIIRAKVKHLLLVGEARDKISRSIDFPDNRKYFFDDFTDSVNKAYELSEPGDNVILSPGCTSYDMFNNFEERGEKFKEIVMKL